MQQNNNSPPEEKDELYNERCLQRYAEGVPGCKNRNLLRRIWMKLFLCSHFSSVGSLIKEEIDNKKVAFIPTASLREGYTGYVGSARKLFNKLGAAVTEIDISTEAYLTIQSVFEDADVIYFTGGNSFFLMDQLRKTGTDELLKKELAKREN